MKIIIFSLNGEKCGVEASQVKEIVQYEELSKMPKMPKFIDGVINLRGNVVPVINLNTRFDLGYAEVTKKTKIIITEIESRFVGYIVNEVSEIADISDENIEKTPELIKKVDNEYIKFVAKKGVELISILDFYKILSDMELKNLNSEQ